MKKNKLLSVIVISFMFIMFTSMPCSASVAELQSQLASIQSQIASINAQIAQLQSQLAQLQGEGGQEGYEGQGEGEDEGDYDDYGDDYDDDIYYDEDGNPYTGDEIDQMIDDGVFDEGGLPDWAMPLDEREGYDFPDDPSQMTGGGVYTSRGVGDGQKITDWNSDPMGTDSNERTREDSDYGPTEGEDDEHSDKDDWAGGSWQDEDPASSGEESFPSPGGSSSGSEDHPHNADGSDASSGGGGMFGFLGNMFADPLVETAATIADAATSPFQDADPASGSSSATGENQPRSSVADMDPEALERLQRHGEALALGMGTGSSGTSSQPSTGGSDFNDRFVTTPASAADAALYGGAMLPDHNRGDMSSSSSSSASSESQSSSTDTPPVKPNTATSGTKTRTGWSQPSRVGAGTTSADSHILPGNQNVMSGSKSSMDGGKDVMRGGRDAIRSAGAFNAEYAAETLALNTDSIRGAKDSLIKVQRTLDDALRQGDISINQYNRAMLGIKQSRAYLDVAESSAGSISRDEVKAMNVDISAQITNVRRMIDASDNNAASIALDKYETTVHQAIDVEQVEELAAAQDVVKQTRFVDTIEMIPADERQIADAVRVEAGQTRFVDSAEMLGVVEERELQEARDVRPVEGRPIEALERRESIVGQITDGGTMRELEGRPVEALERRETIGRPIPDRIEDKYIEGKPIEALQRREEFVRPVTEAHLVDRVESRPVTEAHLDRIVEGRPSQQQEHRAIEVRPVIEQAEMMTVRVDQMETLQEGELVRETLQEEGDEEAPQGSFWSRIFGVAQEEEEDIRYVR